MISMDDIMDMTDLTHDEIAAIAEHESLPDLNAAALAEYMMHTHHGPETVNRMISEDIRDALHKGDKAHARALFVVLQHFVATHPGAARNADR
mgnify:CR=1 FL=1